MRWIIPAAAATLLMGQLAGLAGGAGPGAPASLSGPTYQSVDLGAGLRWQLSLMEELTEHDSIWLHSRIENQADQRFRFDPVPDAARPVIFLTPQGKRPQDRPLVDDAALQRLLVNRQPGPQDVVHEFRADLRAYFGKLEPGAYEVRVAFPEGSIRVQGLPGFKPRAWESPPTTLVVRETPLDKFKKGDAYTLIVRDQPPDPLAVTPRTATVTNSLDYPITFFLEEKAEKGQPLRAWIGCSRFHPRSSWIPVPRKDVLDPAKLPTHRLKPGESVKIVLPDWRVDGDGIYTFRLPCKRDDGTPDALGCLPFVIDHFTQPPAKEKP